MIDLDRLCQQLAEDLFANRYGRILLLPDSTHALAFMRAAEEIEIMLENTTCEMRNFAERKDGEPPPPDSDTPGDDWYLIGIVRGPRRDEAPEHLRAAVKLNWYGESLSILESYGLREEREEAVS